MKGNTHMAERLCMAQMWHLLNDQIRATEGFRFQGIQPIRDYMEICLSELCVAPPTKGSPMLKGRHPVDCSEMHAEC